MFKKRAARSSTATKASTLQQLDSSTQRPATDNSADTHATDGTQTVVLDDEKNIFDDDLSSKRLKTVRPSLTATTATSSKPHPDLLVTDTVQSSVNTAPPKPSATVDVTDDQIARRKIVGPSKPNAGNVRAITMYDYKPDVCKDYRLTGFCSFGDSCKFLHDRSDLKSGWQLEAEFEQRAKKKQERAARRAAGEVNVSDDETEEIHAEKHLNYGNIGKAYKAIAAVKQGSRAAVTADSNKAALPFACLICKQPFGKEPVVTKCNHYFDLSCALQHHSKSGGRCAVCKQPTQGIFNHAEAIVEQQQQKADRHETKEKG